MNKDLFPIVLLVLPFFFTVCFTGSAPIPPPSSVGSPHSATTTETAEVQYN